ncbi:MAG TPA: methyltransferase domain-containing protein [Gemmatimonadaceae bacterium]|nr:methyltransferase domain-containing protein [Gemmatimonadaceae bacterium]
MNDRPSLSDRVRAYARIVRTLSFRLLHQTDTARWADYPFPAAWSTRAACIARLIPPASTVVEFGAGPATLAQFLPAGCTYIATDVVERMPGMRRIDLNARPLPALDDLHAGVAVLAGVLEYLHDAPGVIAWLAREFPRCVVSYVPATRSHGLLPRLRQLRHRIGMGWLNNYTEEQLIDTFRRAGWSLEARAVFPDDPPGDVFAFVNDRKS